MYFIYENNKSMAPAIRASITETFGFEPICINSALVSAQNRQRLYWVGKRNEDGSYSKVDVSQPSDRGILLKDILEAGVDLLSQDKALCVTARISGSTPKHTVEKRFGSMVAEPITILKSIPEIVDKYGYLPETFNAYNRTEITEKAPTLSTGSMATSSCAVNKFEPVRVGCLPSPDGTIKNSQAMRVYSVDAKSVNLTAQGGGLGGKTGLCAIPVRFDGEGVPLKILCLEDGKIYDVYEAKDGLITIKGKQ